MPVATKVSIPNWERACFEDEQNEKYYRLAAELADGKIEWDSAQVGEVLAAAGRDRTALEAEVVATQKRRVHQQAFEALDRNVALNDENNERLCDFLEVKAEKLRELNDQEMQLRAELDASSKSVAASRAARAALQQMRRQSERLNAAKSYAEKLQRDKYALEVRIKKQQVLADQPHKYAREGLDRDAMVKEAKRQVDELQPRLDAAAAELEQARELEAEMMSETLRVL